MKKTTRRKRAPRAVKDLTLAKGAKAVKGGATSTTLMQACATGEHIKQAVIEL